MPRSKQNSSVCLFTPKFNSQYKNKNAKRTYQHINLSQSVAEPFLERKAFFIDLVSKPLVHLHEIKVFYLDI